MLEQIAGKLERRSPCIGTITKEKLIYITYQGFLSPHLTNDSKRYQAPLPVSEAFAIFKRQLLEWGFNNQILKQWTLVIDARDELFCPHEIMYAELDELNEMFSKVAILSNSIYDTNHLKSDYYFYPAACVNIGDWYDKLQELKIDWVNIEITKHFLLLVRRPSKKRVSFVKDTLELLRTPRGINEFITASCGAIDKKELITRPQIVKVNLANNQNKGTSSINHIPGHNEYKKMFYPYPYPMLIDDYVDPLKGVSSLDEKFFKNLVNIVCESLENDNQAVNLSEKTFKPFAWHQIPIWHASPNTVYEVRKLGFDLFDDIIDHSYDSVVPYDDRKSTILDEVKKFKDNYPTVESINNLRHQLMPRLKKNNTILANLVEKEKPNSPHHSWPHKLFR